MRLGNGDDVALWAPGGGSDTVIGGNGFDALVFAGSDDAEQFSLGAGFEGALLFRDLGFIRMDVRETEFVLIVAEGGDDDITFDDLAGSGVDTVRLDLGTGGDRDTISFIGTGAADTMVFASDGNEIDVTGLGATFSIAGYETELDRIIVSLGEGGDAVDAAALDGVGLIVAGGAGSDSIALGSGDDLVAYVGSSGNDSVDGGEGRDIFAFDSSIADDVFRIAGDGTHAVLQRLGDGIAIDLRNVERVDVRGFGGDDRLNGSGVGPGLRLELDGGAGDDRLLGGDGADRLIAGTGSDRLTGGAGPDVFVLSGGNADGVQDLDVVTDYTAGDDALVLAVPIGGFVANALDRGMLLTFTGGDQDQVLLLGVTSLPELTIIG